MRYLSLFLCVYLPILAFSQKIIRGPYLQIGTPTSIVIRWRTDVATNSKVMVGTSPNQLLRSVVDGAVTTEHEITLSELSPNTTYFYNVGSTEVVQAGGQEYYFKTALPVGSTQKIRMWALGDAGDGSPNQRAVRDAYLKTIRGDNRQTDIVMFLGDNAYAIGTDEEYQNNFFNIYQDAFLRNNAVWAIPGNHEYYSGVQESRSIAYFQIFSFPQSGQAGGVPSGTEMYYSFDYGNAHVIALDSYGTENSLRLYDTLSPQVTWLKRDLAANRLPWTIVCFHHPPYAKNYHDSDAAAELVYIRQFLNPILERYKVDLVLNGHNHLYERSYPIRGHWGMSNSFNITQHATSVSSGKYDGTANSCAYIKNAQNDGTIYIVTGSAGRNNGNDGPPHPAMPFKNHRDGGSAVIEIEDNRLDMKFLCFDGIVRDQFTIFKNVNQTTNITAQHGETVKLTPSWKGNYQWSGGSRERTLEWTILGDTSLIVRDSLGCLLDRFNIKLLAKPQMTMTLSKNTMCLGERLSVDFSVANTTAAKWLYTLQLSDAQGSFSNPVTLGSTSRNSVTFTLPNSLPPGDGYRLRLIANVKGIEPVVSSGLAIRQPPVATITGEATIEAGTSTPLTLQFAGSPPWTYRLSDNSTATTSNTPLILNLSPLKTTTYTIEEITNACGVGLSRGNARINVIPILSTILPNSQGNCVGSEMSLPFSQVGQFESMVAYVAELSDANGSFTSARIVGLGTQTPLKVNFPLDLPSGNGYRLRIVPNNNQNAKITPTEAFSVFQKATATMSGDTLIKFGDKATLLLRFSGTSPWTYVLSDNTTGMTSTTPVSLEVSPAIATTYTVASVSNRCGAGQVSGSARINLIITALQTPNDNVEVFPNPTTQTIKIQNKQQSALNWKLSNLQGRIIKEGRWQPSFQNEIFVADLPAGNYVLLLEGGGQSTVYRFSKY